jgi:hypothetical protein
VHEGQRHIVASPAEVVKLILDSGDYLYMHAILIDLEVMPNVQFIYHCLVPIAQLVYGRYGPDNFVRGTEVLVLSSLPDKLWSLPSLSSGAG